MVEVTRRRGEFDETAILAAFRREGLSPRRWANAAGDVYAAHWHPFHKVLYCLRGSIVFRLADGTDIELEPGDRLDLEPGAEHSALVGGDGVECVEAPRYA